MPVDYRHRGCTTPVMRYLKDAPIASGERIKSRDWFHLAEKKQPQPGDSFPKCPDCGKRLKPCRQSLEVVPQAA